MCVKPGSLFQLDVQHKVDACTRGFWSVTSILTFDIARVYKARQPETQHIWIKELHKVAYI